MGFAEWRRQVQLATAVAALIQGQSVSGIARALVFAQQLQRYVPP
jgi:hypothetical protein